MSRSLRYIVEAAASELASADPARAGTRPAPGKWSASEILGHLVDSATNNHRRFVLAPGREDLVFDGYDQEAWVQVQQYQSADWRGLVELWRWYNLHIARLIDVIPVAVKKAPHTAHNLDRIALRAVPQGEATTLEYLMEDYVVHLEHHLTQIRALLSE